MIFNVLRGILLGVLFFYSYFLFAVEIRFPDEELVSETVLPVFENNKSTIMNRNIQLKHKLDFTTSLLNQSDEPLYNLLAVQAETSFYFNENHAFQLSGIYFFPGLSYTGELLLKVEDRTAKNRSYKSFDASLAPHPQFALFAEYKVVSFYGKMSLTKNIVMNFYIGSVFGLGIVALDRDISAISNKKTGKLIFKPAINFQIYQKIFVTRKIFLNLNLGIFGYYGFDPINNKLVNQVNSDNVDFGTAISIRTIVGIGVGALLF